ncbi:MAG: DoxX family protein [Patescibacteria group bacterium]
MFPTLYFYQDIGLLVLRAALGAAFIVHGYPKLFKMYAGFAEWLGSMNIKPGKFWALVVGVVEFFGGIVLILGVFTQLAAALIAVNMLVAMGKVKWGQVKFVEMEKTGWELDLIYFAAAIALMTLGAGDYSVDRYLFWY